MLPSVVELQEYVDELGSAPFADWFDGLDVAAAARVRVSLSRLARGAHSNVKSVGAGVFEYRIDSGPGYRIYFARHGLRLILLLGGGTKRRQDEDILSAKRRWTAYRLKTKED